MPCWILIDPIERQSDDNVFTLVSSLLLSLLVDSGSVRLIWLSSSLDRISMVNDKLFVRSFEGHNHRYWIEEKRRSRIEDAQIRPNGSDKFNYHHRRWSPMPSIHVRPLRTTNRKIHRQIRVVADDSTRRDKAETKGSRIKKVRSLQIDIQCRIKVDLLKLQPPYLRSNFPTSVRSRRAIRTNERTNERDALGDVGQYEKIDKIGQGTFG